MNSIPFSIGTYIPSKQPLLLLSTKNPQTSTEPISHFIKSPVLSSSSKSVNKLKDTINPLPFSFSRRETLSAFGLGFSAIFLEAFLQPQSNIEAIAEEATATECEFTVTPSGLAYCDKVVGYGPEAVKGQLIKKGSGCVLVKLVHPGRRVEIHTEPINTTEVLKRYLRNCITCPDIFKFPWIGFVLKQFCFQAHYVGKLENGKVFDSSYNRGKPLTFRVGVGEVIKGWDQGILGGDGFPPMLTGGKRKLKIPPELGYGIRGAGCRGGTCIIPPDSVLLFDVEFVGKA